MTRNGGSTTFLNLTQFPQYRCLLTDKGPNTWHLHDAYEYASLQPLPFFFLSELKVSAVLFRAFLKAMVF